MSPLANVSRGYHILVPFDYYSRVHSIFPTKVFPTVFGNPVQKWLITYLPCFASRLPIPLKQLVRRLPIAPYYLMNALWSCCPRVTEYLPEGDISSKLNPVQERYVPVSYVPIRYVPVRYIPAFLRFYVSSLKCGTYSELG
jgi:hypothetical protein